MGTEPTEPSTSLLWVCALEPLRYRYMIACHQHGSRMQHKTASPLLRTMRLHHGPAFRKAELPEHCAK
eukprot:7422285-Alexandrium_andersonii.AAC.1